MPGRHNERLASDDVGGWSRGGGRCRAHRRSRPSRPTAAACRRWKWPPPARPRGRPSTWWGAWPQTLRSNGSESRRERRVATRGRGSSRASGPTAPHWISLWRDSSSLPTSSPPADCASWTQDRVIHVGDEERRARPCPTCSRGGTHLSVLRPWQAKWASTAHRVLPVARLCPGLHRMALTAAPARLPLAEGRPATTLVFPTGPGAPGRRVCGRRPSGHPHGAGDRVRAVPAHLEDCAERHHPAGTIYDVGRLVHRGVEWWVGVAPSPSITITSSPSSDRPATGPCLGSMVPESGQPARAPGPSPTSYEVCRCPPSAPKIPPR